jgi:hypothetical protein
MCLESFNLIHSYELAPTTTVTSLVQRVVSDMQNSPLRYEFQPVPGTLLEHEALPLQLLALVNRGSPRISDDQIRLRRVPITINQSVADLAGDRARFAARPICIEDNRFVIHFGMCTLFTPMCILTLPFSRQPFSSYCEVCFGVWTSTTA